MDTPQPAITPERCPECGYTFRIGHTESSHPNHAPHCSRITIEDAKIHIRNYQRAFTDQQLRIASARGRAHFWEGKFHTLRLENNALRRRNRVLEATIDVADKTLPGWRKGEADKTLQPPETKP